MATGLITPNEGRIFLDDEDITEFPVYKRARAGIGYLAQEPSVFRKMSVEDNIASVLELTGKPKDYQREKLESLIREFGLQKVRKNLGDRLSGGERRRTEIARCLAIEPKFIMLDEPFAGVDPIAVEDIQQIVWKLKYRDIGILITDHNVHETLSITDRAYLLFEGRILFQGTPEQLAANPIVREKYLSQSFELKKRLSKSKPMRYFRLTSLLLPLLLHTVVGNAVPARRDTLIVRQPDGTNLTIVYQGDENGVFYTTLDGTPVEKSSDGFWRKSIVMSAAPARTSYMTAAPGSYKVRDFPTEGNPRCLVVLVDFPDRKFTMDDELIRKNIGIYAI